jgi:hypothetical protein
MMITHKSTAGREQTHPNETNDCTVIALANVLGCPYAEAHEIMRKAGRRPRKGVQNYVIHSMLTRLRDDKRIQEFLTKTFSSARPNPSTLAPNVVRGYHMYGRRPRRIGTTVAQFVRTLPRTGRFYLTCTTHAFAYVNGKLLDNNTSAKARALMCSCWEVKLPEAKPVVNQPELTQADINAMWERLNKIKF